MAPVSGTLEPYIAVGEIATLTANNQQPENVMPPVRNCQYIPMHPGSSYIQLNFEKKHLRVVLDYAKSSGALGKFNYMSEKCRKI